MTHERSTACEPYLYLICRRDLPSLSHLIVQLLHAAHQFGAIFAWGHGIPNIVLLEPVADRSELDTIAQRVATAALPHYVYSEPYKNWGMTALIAIARTNEERATFVDMRKWDINFAEGAGMSAHHLGVGLRANPPVAQSQSIRTLNSEGAGASPAGRTTLLCE